MNQPYHGLGQVAGRSSRFADARHGGQKTRRELFQQTPNRKVKSINVHRDTSARNQDVGAGEAALFPNHDRRPFVQHVRRRQFTATHAGEGEQGPDPAFDINPAVGAGGAGQMRHLVQLFLSLHQIHRKGLQACGALLKVQPHQRRDARFAGIAERLAEIDVFGMSVVNQIVVQSVVQWRCRFPSVPASGDQALQC
jgi:hypothetical protein